MEKEKINVLKYNLDLLKLDHIEKTKRYENKNLLSDEGVESAWFHVDEIVDDLQDDDLGEQFKNLPDETKKKISDMVFTNLESDDFFKGLEKYTMIREFAPVLMAELMGNKLGEDKLISSKTTQRHTLLAKETMKYAEALAAEVMDRNPDVKYQNWPDDKYLSGKVSE